MNFGLISKSLREVWLLTLLCGAGVALFETLVVYVFWNYQEQLTEEVLQIEFLRNMFTSLLGNEITENFSPAALRSIAWAHPLVLAIIWTHEITLCTRIPAGEIERGTIDTLVSLPVTRGTIFRSESIVWLLTGGIVIGMMIGGNILGHLLIPAEDRPEMIRSVYVALNLYGLYIAVGGLALLTSTLSDRRGRAVGTAIGIVLVQFIWSFLSQYWSVAQDYSFLSVLDLFKPGPILTTGTFPVGDMALLLLLGGGLWIGAGVVFQRRDICTV